MPDLDKVECKLKPAWRPVYKMVKGDQDIEEVAKATIRALARLLREEGGIPEMAEFAQLVQEHDVGLIDDRSLDVVVNRLEHRMEGRNGKLLARAILKPSVSGSVSLFQGPPDERLIREFLLRKVEHELFACQRRYLTREQGRFSNHQEAVAFESKVLSLIGPELDELVRKIARNPTAKDLRAPRSKTVRRKTTKEFLGAPL